MVAMRTDSRFVYGTSCTFNGPISEIATLPSGLPCCPSCKGVLFEMPSEDNWNNLLKDYVEKTGDQNYHDMWKKLRAYSIAKKCLPLRNQTDLDRLKAQSANGTL